MRRCEATIKNSLNLCLLLCFLGRMSEELKLNQSNIELFKIDSNACNFYGKIDDRIYRHWNTIFCRCCKILNHITDISAISMTVDLHNAKVLRISSYEYYSVLCSYLNLFTNGKHVSYFRFQAQRSKKILLFAKFSIVRIYRKRCKENAK